MFYIVIKYDLVLYQTANNTVDHFRLLAYQHLESSCSFTYALAFGMYAEIIEKTDIHRYRVKVIRTVAVMSTVALQLLKCDPVLDPEVVYPAS